MEYKHIEIMIEDESGKILVDKIMKKYIAGREDISCRINGFKGIGKIPLNIHKISDVKSKQLLTDLPRYLKGMERSLSTFQGKAAIFVILDVDDADCKALKKQLVEMYQGLDLSINVFFCLAIEEMEAWLLGDQEALLKAYPNAKHSVFRKYVQDGVVGTWECLADVVYKGGLMQLRKDADSYYMIGKFKCECAEQVGQHMVIERNISPSFQHFIKKLDSFCMTCS